MCPVWADVVQKNVQHIQSNEIQGKDQEFRSSRRSESEVARSKGSPRVTGEKGKRWCSETILFKYYEMIPM